MIARAVLSLTLAAGIADAANVPPQIRALTDLARSAPPEFAADALLRIVESGRVQDKDASRAMLNDAFQLASSAHFPIRMRAIRSVPMDSRAGMLGQAYALKLDALSLQSRAVMAMLSVDKKRAREMFTDIPRPQLAPLACTDALVYDPGDYYSALAAVAQNGFTEAEHKKEEHINFLLAYTTATSAAQLPALAMLAKRVALTQSEREILITRVNGILENVAVDSRSYAATLDDLRSQVVPEMAVSFQKYMDRQSHAEACPDSKGTDKPTPDPGLYWQNSVAQTIMQAVHNLRFGTGLPQTSTDVPGPTPQQQFDDLLKQIAAWTPGSENSETDYFHEKCLVYQSLLETVPASEQSVLLDAFLAYLETSNLQRESPPEWFVHARLALDRVKGAGKDQLAKVLSGFQSSGDPVLALYASLERTFENDMPSWVAMPGGR